MKALILTCCSSAALILSGGVQADVMGLEFNSDHYESKTIEYDGQSIQYRAYESIPYVTKPVVSDYQVMNIYIPEAYFQGGSIQGYQADTAPIFLPNQVGGYMPGKAMVVGTNDRTEQANSALVALSKGLVVAAPAARGRTNQTADGRWAGKAPAAIVDLKAAVRYLHFNDGVMPGDANKIVSNGTSAGGALSALLGASADSTDYDTYLTALGAAPGSDAIWAVSAYCPITNLEHADMAYEWQFNGYNDYQKMNISMLDYQVKRELVAGTLTEEEQQVSDQLKPLFPEYVNSLGLKDSSGHPLTLDQAGNGSFKDAVVTHIQVSAQSALEKGQDLSSFEFVTIDQGRVTAIDWDKYRSYAVRQKLPPAFDALDLSAGENNLFGNALTDNQHFTEFSTQHSTVAAKQVSEGTVKLMNPMNYIGTSDAQTAAHWRIRVGTKDRDTSLAISAILAAKLENTGHDVDYFMPWDVPHSGDYDLDELFTWIKSIQ